MTGHVAHEIPARRQREAGPPTRNEEVSGRLRADILTGRLFPGSRLRSAELVERYDCSTGVVREALTRLAEQGLVEAEPQHGFRVITLSVDDLRDLTVARCELEGLVLRMSIEHGDLAWESRVVAAHHALGRTRMEHDDDPTLLRDEWTRANAHFHEVLLSACPNQRLFAMASSLRESADLYRRWSLPLATYDHERVHEEHRALTDAAVRHDADAAVQILHEHISRVRAALSADATDELDANGHPSARRSR